MHSLKDIWEIAKADDYATALDGDGYESRLVYGTKIVYDHATDSVSIFNTAKGGGFYEELPPHQLNYFHERGWRLGVYQVGLDTLQEKLERIEGKIKKEMNGRKNPKQIQSMKKSRERVMNQYSKLKIKSYEYEAEND